MVLLSVLNISLRHQWLRYQRAILSWEALGMPLSWSASMLRAFCLLALPLWQSFEC